MGYHLVALVMAPFALCCAGALASAIWPSRIALWACLLPAWVLAAMLFGLRQIRDEIAGPVLTWCRVGTLDLGVAAVALPASALIAYGVRRSRGTPAMAPWRFGVLQALVATVAVLPLPTAVLVASWASGAAWRTRWESAGFTAAAFGVSMLWPQPGMIDLATAGLLLVSAARLRRDGAGGKARTTGQAWTLFCACAGLLAIVRAATLA